MTYEEVDENLFLFRDDGYYDVIIGALALPNKLIMVDSGTNIPWLKEFRKFVESRTGKRFEALILTHHHGDHTFGNQIMKDCRIICSKPVLKKMKSMKRSLTPKSLEARKKNLKDPTALEGFEYILPNETFENKLEIVDDDVKVVIKRTDGHSEGSSYIYCPNYKVLFAGDNLLSNFIPFGGDASCEPDLWMEACKEYLALDVARFIPGHGNISDKTLVRKTMEYIKEVRDLMKKMMAEGKTEEEILAKSNEIRSYRMDINDPLEIRFKKATLKRWYNVWVKR